MYVEKRLDKSLNTYTCTCTAVAKLYMDKMPRDELGAERDIHVHVHVHVHYIHKYIYLRGP